MLNGADGYGNSATTVTGAERPPTMTIPPWAFPVTVWKPRPCSA
jgi:hypothetical protein